MTNVILRSESRRERRLAVNTAVTVKLLGMLGEPTVTGRVLDMSGSGVRVMLPTPMPCGGKVRIEGDGLVMFGEVVRCAPNGDAYSLGIALSHSEAGDREAPPVRR